MNIRGRLKVPADIPSASQADIAFLLLIFFIATTMFDAEVGIPLVLPGAVSQKVQIQRKNVLTISSDANGSVYLDGQAVAIPEIYLLVQDKLRENPKLIVSIETHPQAAYGVMIGVLDQVKKAKAERISLKLNRG